MDKLDKKYRTATYAGLSALIFLTYYRIRFFSFVNFDDPSYVTANPVVLAGFTRDSFLEAFTGIISSNWHPVTILSHMLDYQLFGLNSGLHHLALKNTITNFF